MTEDRRRMRLVDLIKIISFIATAIVVVMTATTSYVHTQDTVGSMKSVLDATAEATKNQERRIIILEETMKSIDKHLSSIDKKLDR